MSNWIKGAIKHPGAFTAKAKKAGMSVAEFASHVKANKGDYDSTTVKEAVLAQTLRRMKK